MFQRVILMALKYASYLGLIYKLNLLTNIINKEDVGLYRDSDLYF